MRKQAFILFFVLAVVTNHVFSQIQLSLTVKQPTCIKAIGHDYQQFGDGSIFVTVSGGIPPYTFTVSGLYGLVGATQNNNYFPGLIAGPYTVSIIDAIGQYASTSTTLTSSYSMPTLNIVSRDSVTNCDGTNGAIHLSAQGGTAPYLYSIDGGSSYSSNGNFTGLSSGVYAILAKDNIGCITPWNTGYTGTGTMLPPFISIPFSKNSCNLSIINFYGFTDLLFSLTSCNIEGGADIRAFYNKDLNGNVLGNGMNLKFSIDGINYGTPLYTPANNYTQSLADTIIKGQPSGLINFYIKDTVTGLKARYVFPVGQSCDVYIKYIKTDASCGASDGAFTVQARNGDAPYTYSMDGINFQTDSTFYNLPAGNYSVSVKDATGVITSSMTTLYNKCPKVIATATYSNCNQNNGTIQAHGYLGTKPYQFSLDNINFQSDSLFKGLTNKVYTVYLKDAKNFIDSITNIEVKNYCINITTTVSNETCGNKNGSITVNPIGGVQPYQYSIDGINFQGYNVFTGLDSGTYTITIKDANLNNANTIVSIINLASPSVNIITDTASCKNTNGSITITTTTNGTSPFQYSIDGINYQNNNIFSNDTAGVYVVRIKDANGCLAKDTVTIFKYPTPIVFIGNDTTLCTGQSLTLNAGNSFTSYLWSNNATTSNITISVAGKYYVTVTDTHNCTVADTINIAFTQTPIFTLGNDTVLCEKQTLILQSNASGNYLWQDGSTAKQKTITSAGLYWLQINNNNCIYRDSILINYIPLPILNLPADTILCNQNTLVLNATQTGNAATYLWQDGSVASNYLVTNAGTFMIKVTDKGCTNNATCIVQYQQTPPLTSAHDTTKCKNESILLDVSFPNANYLWQDFSSLPTYTINVQGDYYCTITNYCGWVTDTFHITDKICECTLIIPNTFSPNGDGINDFFKPNIDCVPSYYHMVIFDRNGHVIYTSHNISDYWNGTYQNKAVPIGTYYYILKIKGISDPIIKEKSGSLTLLR